MNAVNGLPHNVSGNSKYLWLLDAGHGGILHGKYATAPAKMFTYPDGMQIFEGVINRAITDKLAAKLKDAEIDYQYIHDADEDTTLNLRVMRADSAYYHDKRSVYLSIHSNSGGGSGFEIFTSHGQTKSDKIANIFCQKYIEHFELKPFRDDKLSDGDLDKEADFFVLRKTDCPALLVENLFFDNRMEADFLLTPIGQNAIANCLLDAIQTCEKLKPI